jgi:hypothetical protein
MTTALGQIGYDIGLYSITRATANAQHNLSSKYCTVYLLSCYSTSLNSALYAFYDFLILHSTPSCTATIQGHILCFVLCLIAHSWLRATSHIVRK